MYYTSTTVALSFWMLVIAGFCLYIFISSWMLLLFSLFCLLLCILLCIYRTWNQMRKILLDMNILLEFCFYTKSFYRKFNKIWMRVSIQMYDMYEWLKLNSVFVIRKRRLIEAIKSIEYNGRIHYDKKRAWDFPCWSFIYLGNSVYAFHVDEC